MVVPHDAKAERHKPSAERPRAAAKPNGHLKVNHGDEILLVEDEPLVAMMLTDMLTEMGLRVNGPHGTLADAMIAAHSSDLKAAILDVNLGGDKIYPVAEILAGQNISFVFVTGYGRDSIDPRFGDVVILQKPIERQKLWSLLVNVTAVPHDSNVQS
jgi:CheY-like chemotaxis protein